MTRDQLIACCGSCRWADLMLARQPFNGTAAIHKAADEIWWSLTTEDWLEAFSKHPKIGQPSSAKWTAEEQSGMSQAAAATAGQMAQLNVEYDAKFGFIFIVCATGKTAEEMLQLIHARITNPREAEIRIAAEEQAKITHLRIDKLLAE